MTDLATATADTTNLPDYAGRKVARTTISIRNAGDGLSEGLGIDPQVLTAGEKVYVVLECVVHAHDHVRLLDRKADTGLWVLDQVLKAETGVMVDADLVASVIAAQKEKIQRARDSAEGRQRLPYDEELHAAHENGEHSEGLVDGCADCQAEADAVAAESAPPEPTPIGRGKRS